MDSIRKHAVRIQSSSSTILGVLEVLREPSTISLLNSRLAAARSSTNPSGDERDYGTVPSSRSGFSDWLGIFASLILLLTLRSTSSLHRGKELRLHDLSHKIKAEWTRPAITFFLIVLLIIVYFFAMFSFISAAIFGSGCVCLVVLANTVVLVEIFFYLHIANIWISVMEDDFIGKEEKGRKLQGVALMVVLAASVVNPALLSINKSGKNETFIRSSGGIGILGFFYLVKLIGFVVYAVFLHECRKAKEEQVEIGEKQDNTLITNNEV
uniref:Uncharacterized protein n=1 Tax=Ananas comosus var. bracteatus TaxID=296719 RepID=A0A6V7PB07_ANACO|nr:unnamed protein product [Ananas comosus var. bracteatus]